jgi:hypothetical protein
MEYARKRRSNMAFRIRREEHGGVETVPNEGMWYNTVEQATSLKAAFEKFSSGATYWIEDEDGQKVTEEKR